jgi:hypothetical protein
MLELFLAFFGGVLVGTGLTFFGIWLVLGRFYASR